MRPVLSGIQTVNVPPIGSSVNRGSGLAQGLVGAIIVGSDFGIRDLVNPSIAPTKTSRWTYGDVSVNLNNTSRYVVSPHRVVAIGTNSSINGPSLGERNDWTFTSTDSFTVHVRASAALGITSGQGIPILGKNNGTSPVTGNGVSSTWVIGIMNATGSPRAAFWSGDGSTFRSLNTNTGTVLGSDPRSFWDITAVATPSGITLYVNGKEDKTISAAGLNLNSTANNFFVGQSIGTSNRAFNFSHGYVWRRALTRDEVIRLCVHPYEVITPPRPIQMFSSSIFLSGEVGIEGAVSSGVSLSGDLANSVGIEAAVDYIFAAIIGTNNAVGIEGSLETQSALETALTGTVGIPAVMTSTFDGADLDTWRPVMRPDGQLLLVSRTPVGDHDSVLTDITLWSFQADGTGEWIELGDPAQFGWDTYQHPDWSPDGEEIVLAVETTTEYELVTVDASAFGTNEFTFPTPVSIHAVAKPDECFDPSYSPDGALVVFGETDGSIYQICTLSLGATPVQTVLQTSSERMADPTFSFDGNFVLFAEQTGAVSGPEPYGRWALKYMNADGSGVTTILDDDNANIHPAWVSTTQIAFQCFRYGTDSAFQIAVIDLAGNGRTQLGEGEYPRTVIT